jgi:hypothetical protein
MRYYPLLPVLVVWHGELGHASQWCLKCLEALVIYDIKKVNIESRKSIQGVANERALETYFSEIALQIRSRHVPPIPEMSLGA